MLIYIIRHGETDFNRQGRIQGQVDNPLNENGIRLGRITGEGLKDVKFDMIFSSPLKRALQTADLVTSPSKVLHNQENIPLFKDDRLMEIDCGIWDGKLILHDHMEIEDPTFPMFFNDPEHFPGFPEGETTWQVIERTGEVLDELIRREDLQDKTVLVSTHGCAMRGMLQRFYQDGRGYWHGGSPNNYAVNVVKVEKGKAELIHEDLLFYDPAEAVNPYN